MHLFVFAAALVSIAPVHDAAPNRQPQLAVKANQVDLVFGSDHAIWMTQSNDDGDTFSAPKKIIDTSLLALGRHRGPRVVVSGKTIVVSAIAGKAAASAPHAHGAPSDGDLLVWRSQDDGNTWSQPLAVNDQPGAAREGLHAMTADTAGTLAAVWLDLRSPGTRLYGAVSHDAGKTWSKNILLAQSPDGTICQCCDPSIVATGVDEFAVMFRNSVAGDRDMYVTRWRNGTEVSTPQKLGTSSWKLNACPMDGGGIANDKGQIVTAWRRDQTVFSAEPGKAEAAIGTGKDVALAAGRKGPYIAWVTTAGIQISEPGKSSPTSLSRAGAFPTLLALPDGSVLAAWEEEGAIKAQHLSN